MIGASNHRCITDRAAISLCICLKRMSFVVREDFIGFLAGQINANMQPNRANGVTSTKIGVMTP